MKRKYFHTLESELIFLTFTSFKREQAVVIKFCQIALAAPSIVGTVKQALLKQRNRRQQIETSPTFENFTK